MISLLQSLLFSMFIDLNVPHTPSTTVAKQAHMVESLKKLGYSCVAFNNVVTAPLKPSDMCKIPIVGSQPPSMHNPDETTLKTPITKVGHTYDILTAVNKGRRKRERSQVNMKKLLCRGNGLIEAGKKQSLEKEIDPFAVSEGDDDKSAFVEKKIVVPPSSYWLQLSRITVVIDSPRNISEIHVNNEILKTYDIVAVRPSTHEAMKAAINSNAVDIIDLNISGGRLPFPVKKADIDLALKNGVSFEITYAPALRDNSNRRNLISNTLSLLRMNRKSGFFISSGAENSTELRNLTDLSSLFGHCGIVPDIVRYAQTSSCIDIIAHAEKRHFRRGYILHVLNSYSKSSNNSSKGVIENVIVKIEAKSATQDAIVKSYNENESIIDVTSNAPINNSGGSCTAPWLTNLAARGLGFANVESSVSNMNSSNKERYLYNVQGWKLAAPIMPPVIPRS